MKKDYLGSEFKKLGFGFMRLPMLDDTTEKVIDMEQTKKMVDIFMEKGFTYFDTAYVYIEGKSEMAIKEAVVDRYPRESFQVATKLPLWPVKEKADLEKLFTESATRAGVDYFDFYLIHCLNEGTIAKADEFDAWGFVKGLKADGRAKHIGFSFHDKAAKLDELLTAHPEVEFVQLQINYIDWESNDVEARKCYEVALKHNKPIIVMEPVKGGTLANVTPAAEKAFKEYNKEASPASWAIRYTASLENIVTVLSGMSNMEQLEDNVSYMENFEAINTDEKAVIENVVDIINSIPTIPCTDCKYCVEGCPMNINIPQMFKIVNQHKKYGTDPQKPSNVENFLNNTKENGRPSECIACGACEGHCPQHIEIINELSEIAKLYEA